MSPNSEITSQLIINKYLWADKALASKANIHCLDTITHLTTETHSHTIQQMNPVCPCMTWQRGRTCLLSTQDYRREKQKDCSQKLGTVAWQYTN